jgi:hypothetical protein
VSTKLIMSINEEITTQSALKLKVEKTESNGQVQVFLRTEVAKKILLHWACETMETLRGA